MSVTISVEEAQTKLKEPIRKLAPGEEIVITENHQPMAKLVSQQPRAASGIRTLDLCFTKASLCWLS